MRVVKNLIYKIKSAVGVDIKVYIFALFFVLANTAFFLVNTAEASPKAKQLKLSYKSKKLSGKVVELEVEAKKSILLRSGWMQIQEMAPKKAKTASLKKVKFQKIKGKKPRKDHYQYRVKLSGLSSGVSKYRLRLSNNSAVKNITSSKKAKEMVLNSSWSKWLSVSRVITQPPKQPAPQPPSQPEPSPPLHSLQFPIELIWPEGSTKQVIVDTPAGAIATTFKIHNLANQDMGSVRVKSVDTDWSEWRKFSNNNITLLSYGNDKKEFYGIGGGFSTREFVMNDLPIFPEKRTIIELRFDHTDFISTAYRVLDINFLDQNGEKLLSNSIVKANYEGLPSHLKDPMNVAIGKGLWMGKSLVEGPGRPVIKAKCASCHVTDGIDLKFFGFSPETISLRSQFHGFSKEEGDLVAAFIASLPVQQRSNPWDPPLQPGPGQSSVAVEDWFKGAGVSAVLAEPQDMMKHLVGDQTTPQDFFFDTPIKENDIPLPLELPDWNSWLPSTHFDDFIPGDIFATQIEPLIVAFEKKFFENPNKKSHWEPSLISVVYAGRFKLYIDHLLMGERAAPDSATRRKYHDANRLLATRLIGTIYLRHPNAYGKVLSSHFFNAIFGEFPPFEPAGTNPILFRNITKSGYLEFHNTRWWLAALQGFNSAELVEFRFNYMSSTFGARSAAGTGPINLLYFKKMLEKHSLFDVNGTPLERIFIPLATDPVLKNSPGLADAMVEAVMDKIQRKGGVQTFYASSSFTSPGNPLPSHPDQTWDNMRTFPVASAEPTILRFAYLYNSTVCKNLLSQPTKQKFQNLLEEIWPIAGWGCPG
jgi:hypothetical protein